VTVSSQFGLENGINNHSDENVRIRHFENKQLHSVGEEFRKHHNFGLFKPDIWDGYFKTSE